MINLLPWPWSWVATAFLDAVLTFIVPKIPDANLQNLVETVINFLLTGVAPQALADAAAAHADSQKKSS